MIHDSLKKAGLGTTVGATSYEIINQPITGLTAALLYQVAVIGVDRANPAATVTYVSGQGGGINLGIITLLPQLFGGIQKSLSLLLANVTVGMAGGYLTVTVTGVAGRTLDWAAEINLLALEP